ncbi:hypothetical protein NEMIN01_2402 [Nematocida minor]|uniref:uncharacterized protein n=1 Tax=Nematocida minor TaxID=1912983 RepID=UPI00221E6110|nr:uncharacterized protein NEMIN01_2402 [Nematocida minor]KAI5193194.1 hypothetical protein NEMIN01_2402 [Nematocida minor]
METNQTESVASKVLENSRNILFGIANESTKTKILLITFGALAVIIFIMIIMYGRIKWQSSHIDFLTNNIIEKHIKNNDDLIRDIQNLKNEKDREIRVYKDNIERLEKENIRLRDEKDGEITIYKITIDRLKKELEFEKQNQNKTTGFQNQGQSNILEFENKRLKEDKSELLKRYKEVCSNYTNLLTEKQELKRALKLMKEDYNELQHKHFNNEDYSSKVHGSLTEHIEDLKKMHKEEMGILEQQNMKLEKKVKDLEYKLSEEAKEEKEDVEIAEEAEQ